MAPETAYVGDSNAPSVSAVKATSGDDAKYFDLKSAVTTELSLFLLVLLGSPVPHAKSLTTPSHG